MLKALDESVGGHFGAASFQTFPELAVVVPLSADRDADDDGRRDSAHRGGEPQKAQAPLPRFSAILKCWTRPSAARTRVVCGWSIG